jgi:octaprenyl-diphosphate synthase
MPMDINQIRALSNDDMQAVNHLIQQQVDSDVALINQLGFYIVNSGGKRLRPLLTVLSARAMGIENADHHTLAAIVEFIHTATLLHDDVVDESTMRRGRETANAVFGNQASVLVGEVLQLMNCNDASTTEARYFDVIYGKTARLFEAATQLAAVLTDQPENVEHAMQEYGKHLGTAFQLADDILDYMADSDEMGKNAGDDLAEGKPTLPLLYAMWNTDSEEDKALIRDAIEQSNGLPHLTRIQQIMESTGALDYTRTCANNEVKMAIDSLSIIPDSPYKEALIALAHISVERTS